MQDKKYLRLDYDTVRSSYLSEIMYMHVGESMSI